MARRLPKGLARQGGTTPSGRPVEESIAVTCPEKGCGVGLGAYFDEDDARGALADHRAEVHARG